jgi:hypothetical protein
MMARDSCMPMFWKCWSRKQTLMIYNPGFHFEVDIKLIFLPNLTYFGIKMEDNLMVFNLWIIYSYMCDRYLADLDKTLKSFAYFFGVLGQISFLKGKFSDFLTYITFTICDLVLGLMRIMMAWWRLMVTEWIHCTECVLFSDAIALLLSSSVWGVKVLEGPLLHFATNYIIRWEQIGYLHGCALFMKGRSTYMNVHRHVSSKHICWCAICTYGWSTYKTVCGDKRKWAIDYRIV